jgi:hypothetical protein
VQVFDGETERLDPALTQEEALTGLDSLLTTEGSLEDRATRLFDGGVHEREEHRQHRHQAFVEPDQLAADLLRIRWLSSHASIWKYTCNRSTIGRYGVVLRYCAVPDSRTRHPSVRCECRNS